jgi:hypothetical protein
MATGNKFPPAQLQQKLTRKSLRGKRTGVDYWPNFHCMHHTTNTIGFPFHCIDTRNQNPVISSRRSARQHTYRVGSLSKIPGESLSMTIRSLSNSPWPRRPDANLEVSTFFDRKLDNCPHVRLRHTRYATHPRSQIGETLSEANTNQCLPC